MNRALPMTLALALAACGGSPPPEEQGPDEEPHALEDERTPEERERAQKLERLRAAQESVCEKMCPEITGCAIEDARANMSEEELAKLDLENTAPRHTAQCKDECKASELSPRQVLAIQECLTQGGECRTFLGCLEKAQQGGG